MNDFQVIFKSKKRADGKFSHLNQSQLRRDHVKKVVESHESSSNDDYVKKFSLKMCQKL